MILINYDLLSAQTTVRERKNYVRRDFKKSIGHNKNRELKAQIQCHFP